MDDSFHFEIDGMRPGGIERPETVPAVADILSTAASDGLGMAPVGGGGALGLGNPVERYDLALDMRELNRILEHQASDLVLSVEAGVTLGEIADALSPHGQWLPIEAPNPDRATVGGLIATALSGPGRLAHGSLRDYLIGISVATPAGKVAKAGGMVVKNVSGFDLMRLHHGALGTLGIIVSANFKVLPAPRGQATVVLECPTVEAALDSVGRLESTAHRPSAVLVAQIAKMTGMVCRFDGLPSQTFTAATDAAASLGIEAKVLQEDESRAWWRDEMNTLSEPSGEGAEVRLGARPGAITSLVRAVVSVTTQHDISLEFIRTWPGLGTVIVRLAPPVAAVAVDNIISIADDSGATWRITAAPPTLKRGRDVWGRPPASLETMRRLKAQFDPGRNLNPGRFSGHI